MTMSIRQILQGCSRKWFPYHRFPTAAGSMRYESIYHKSPQHTAYQQTRNYSTEEITWLWEVNDHIKGLNEGAKYGTRFPMLELTFNSVKPLEPEHFHQALDYLMRKFPNMRTVVRKKDEASWFCQLPNYKKDFKILSNEETFREDCLDLMDEGFNESDSLPWKARLSPRSPDAPCYIKGVKKTHPYQYDFSFIVNHAQMDAITGYKMFSCILHALNCIVGGIPFGDEEYGVFENNTDFEVKVDQSKKELLQDPAKFTAIKQSLPSLSDTPSIIQAFPRPDVLKPNTKYLFREINPDMMTGLLAKCKQMRVKFSSFSISACNIAMAELMEEAGTLKDVYELYTLGITNKRRYFATPSFILGCYVTALTYKSEVSSSMRASFWNYCRRVDHDLKLLYDKGQVFYQSAMQAILDAEHEVFNYTDNARPVVHDYTSNCIGDITKFFSNGDYVKLTNVTPLQKIHNYRNGLELETYTFEGRTRFHFKYPDNYFSQEVVSLIADRILRVYEEVGK